MFWYLRILFTKYRSFSLPCIYLSNDERLNCNNHSSIIFYISRSKTIPSSYNCFDINCLRNISCWICCKKLKWLRWISRLCLYWYYHNNNISMFCRWIIHNRRKTFFKVWYRSIICCWDGRILGMHNLFNSFADILKHKMPKIKYMRYLKWSDRRFSECILRHAQISKSNWILYRNNISNGYFECNWSIHHKICSCILESNCW